MSTLCQIRTFSLQMLVQFDTSFQPHLNNQTNTLARQSHKQQTYVPINNATPNMQFHVSVKMASTYFQHSQWLSHNMLFLGQFGSHMLPAFLATLEAMFKPYWFQDPSISHHVTANLANLAISQPYIGGDKLVIGNGKGLSILDHL